MVQVSSLRLSVSGKKKLNNNGPFLCLQTMKAVSSLVCPYYSRLLTTD